MNLTRRTAVLALLSLTFLSASALAAEPPPLLASESVCKMWWLGTNTAQAKTFYTNMFQWTFRTPFELQGRVFVPWNDGTGPGGDITTPDPGGTAIWRPYVRVTNLSTALQRATSLGGSVLIPATAYGTAGSIVAVVKDPTGLQMGLWYSPAAPATGGTLGNNSVYHMRLYTSDPARAKTFYAGMFTKWTWSAPITIGGRLYQPWDDGTGPGGDIVRPLAGEQAGWRTFVRVAQLEAAIQTATRNGARVVVPATLHGTAGRYAVVADPGGVLLGLWEI